MIDERNDWKYICMRLKGGEEDKLWDYLTALRSMDTKEQFDCTGVKMILTDPLRGVCDGAGDIRITYKILKGFRSWVSVVRFIKHLVVEMDRIEYHYMGHTIAGWRAIGENDIANHLEEMNSPNRKDQMWALLLMCKVNKFVRKVCVRGELIG